MKIVALHVDCIEPFQVALWDKMFDLWVIFDFNWVESTRVAVRSRFKERHLIFRQFELHSFFESFIRINIYKHIDVDVTSRAMLHFACWLLWEIQSRTAFLLQVHRILHRFLMLEPSFPLSCRRFHAVRLSQLSVIPLFSQEKPAFLSSISQLNNLLTCAWAKVLYL